MAIITNRSGVWLWERKMGPNYACLCVGYVERKMFEEYQGRKPDLYKRYIDDVLGASSDTRQDLENFIHFCSTYYPALKYMFDISESRKLRKSSWRISAFWEKTQTLRTYLTTNPCASIGEKVISVTSWSIVALPPTLSKTKHHQEHFQATDPCVAPVTARRRLIR